MRDELVGISKKNTNVTPINLINSSNRKELPSIDEFFLVDTSAIKKGKIQYTHPYNNYTLEYVLVGNQLRFDILNNKDRLSLYMEVSGPRQEKNLDSGFTSERNSSNLYYSYNDGKFKKMSYAGNDEKSNIEKPISWIAYKQQFFSTIFSSNSSFKVNYMKIESEGLDSSIVKKMISKISVKKSTKTSFSFYFLPNDFNLLKTYPSGEGASFENLVRSLH